MRSPPMSPRGSRAAQRSCLSTTTPTANGLTPHSAAAANATSSTPSWTRRATATSTRRRHRAETPISASYRRSAGADSSSSPPTSPPTWCVERERATSSLRPASDADDLAAQIATWASSDESNCESRPPTGLKEDRKDVMAHLDTDLLKPTDVARRLGVSRSWVYDAAASGRIPCLRLGGPDGPLRFLSEDVETWLEQARRNCLPGESSKQVTRRAARLGAEMTPQRHLDE